MAGDKTYIEDTLGNQHRATRTKAVTPESIVWSSNPNDYTVQVRISGKWHRAVLTYNVRDASFFDNINIDKALVTGGDGRTHTALLVSPEASAIIMSSIPTDEHSLISGTTTGETVVNTYSENWSNVVWQDNVNVYKVLVEGSDGKIHTALLTTEGAGGGAVEVIVKGVSPLSLPDAIADSLSYVKAFGGTEQRNLPDGYIERQFIYMMDGSYLLTDIVPTPDCKIEFDFQTLTIVSGARTYLGCRDSSGSNDGLRVAHISSGNFRIYGFGTYTDSATAVQSNTRYKFVWNNKQATITTGGTTVFDNIFAAEGTNQTVVAINGWNTAGTVDANSEGIYLYSFKVWDNQGNLIADYVPAVQRGTVPVVGFYDTVSETFKTATAGTFAAGGEAVPTPDTPMDIVSNNGVLKARHQSGLPLGYTLLDYIESNGTQYIDLGVKGNGNTKVSVEYRYHTNTSASGSGRVFGSRTTSSSNAFAIGTSSGVVSATANKAFWCYDAQSFFVIDGPTFPIGDWQTVVFSATEHTLNGVSYGDDYNVVEFETPQNLKLFGFDNGGTMGYGQVDIARCKLWDNGVLVRDLVPAKNNSNVIGMYDTVSGQFFTNAGTGDFTAGSAVSDPVEIYTDGTVETINVHSKNLFDSTPYKTGYYIDASGNEQPATQYQEEYLIRQAIVQPSTQYTVSFVGVNSTYTQRFHAYDKNGNWISQLTYLIPNVGNVTSATFTTPSNCKYIRQGGRTQTDYQLERGSTATTYAPYYDGGTATAEMLLKISDIADQQEIIDGTVTRKIGVKVFDGTEGWTQSAATNNLFYTTISNSSTDNTYTPISSHFQGVVASTGYAAMTNGQFKHGSGTNSWYFKNTDCANATAFSQWLADQYAAGTPVVIIYPLATATTESVAGQTLQVQDGDNIVEITQASLDGLELEAEYQAAVSLTIQEVQDANLDPNVQVTIN